MKKNDGDGDSYNPTNNSNKNINDENNPYAPKKIQSNNDSSEGIKPSLSLNNTNNNHLTNNTTAVNNPYAPKIQDN